MEKILEPSEQAIEYYQLKKLHRRKRLNIRYAAILRAMGEEKRSRRVYDCMRIIHYDNGKAISSYLCGDRFCPICQWRRANDTYHYMQYIIENLPKPENIVMMTVTVPNCAGSELRDTIRNITKRINEMFRSNPLYKYNVLGRASALEVTYNSKTDTYHPHYHYVLYCSDAFAEAVRMSDVNRKRKRFYPRLSPATGLKYHWSHFEDKVREVFMQYIGYEPEAHLDENGCSTYLQCRIEGVRRNGNISSAVTEFSKYCLKVIEDNYNDKVISTLYGQLSGLTTYSYAGVFKKMKKVASLLHKAEIKENAEDSEQNNILRNKGNIKSYIYLEQPLPCSAGKSISGYVEVQFKIRDDIIDCFTVNQVLSYKSAEMINIINRKKE